MHRIIYSLVNTTDLPFWLIYLFSLSSSKITQTNDIFFHDMYSTQYSDLLFYRNYLTNNNWNNSSQRTNTFPYCVYILPRLWNSNFIRINTISNAISTCSAQDTQYYVFIKCFRNCSSILASKIAVREIARAIKSPRGLLQPTWET